MSTTVLVSNLALAVDSSMLEDMFSLVGNVQKAVVQMDAISGLSRGFGFVEMSTDEEAKNCVLHFNGQKKEGLTLMVHQERLQAAKPTEFKSVARRPLFLKTARAANRTIKGGVK